MSVNTVTGPIEVSQLGPTLMHEHVCSADWSLRMNFGKDFFDPDKVVQGASEMLMKVKEECGITTVVDGTPINLGRDVRLIREVAQRTGLNIIVSSGFYHQEEFGLMVMPEDTIYHLLLEECQNGITDTGILPGIMKVAVDKGGLTPYLVKIFTAVARVAAQTGLPVFCHHNVANRNGAAILDIFEKHGVDLNKFILGHSGDTNDIEYLLAMLSRGCYIGMDRFAYCDFTLGLEQRVATIATLCEKGYADKMLLSHDLVVLMALTKDLDPLQSEMFANPLPDFTFIHKTVQPALLSAGLSQEEFDKMLVDNPKRFFEGD